MTPCVKNDDDHSSIESTIKKAIVAVLISLTDGPNGVLAGPTPA